MTEELLEVLDEDGRVVGVEPRTKVHSLGLPHRAVHILVRDPSGRLLLQKRANDKETAPGLWDTSVGGHVPAGEPVLLAALREAREELGLTLAPQDLRPLPDHCVDLPLDQERVQSWETVSLGPFTPDPKEVQDLQWFDPSGIASLIDQGRCSPHFVVQWERWLQRHLAFPGLSG